jgi:hypothetical protein
MVKNKINDPSQKEPYSDRIPPRPSCVIDSRCQWPKRETKHGEGERQATNRMTPEKCANLHKDAAYKNLWLSPWSCLILGGCIGFVLGMAAIVLIFAHFDSTWRMGR